MVTSSKILLLSGALWNGFSIVVSRALPAFLTIILAWLLRPSELGTISFILSSYTVLSPVADWGIAYAFQKFIPENPSRAGPVLWTALVLRAGISLILSTGCWLLDSFLGVFRGYGLHVSVLLMASVLGSGVFALNAQYRFREISLLSILHSVSWLISAIIMVLVGLRIEGPVYGMALAYLIMGIVFFTVVLDFPSSVKLDRSIARDLISFGGWATAVSGLNAFIGQAGILALSYLVGAHETGVYKVALTLSMAPLLLGNAITLPLLPLAKRSLLMASEETVEMVRLLIRYLLMVGMLVVGAGVVLAKPLIETLVSNAYAGAIGPFRILLVANLLGMLFTVLATIPFMGEGLRELSRISLQVAIMVLASSLILIPLWGNNGAALALLLAYAVGLVLLAGWFRQRLPCRLEWRRYVVYGLATIEMMGVILPLVFLVHNPAMQLGLGTILATVIYLIALLIHKGISMDEISALVRLGIGNILMQTQTEIARSVHEPQ